MEKVRTTDGFFLAAMVAFTGLTSLLLAACGGGCVGEDCGCQGRDECIISCQGDGCDLACFSTGRECGAVCGDDCSFECHDTPHCSSYSGVSSVMECHSVSSCAAECGADCDYHAYSVSEVHVVVGEGSQVRCESVSTCEVECQGACDVSCDGVSTCEVTCTAASPTNEGNDWSCP